MSSPLAVRPYASGRGLPGRRSVEPGDHPRQAAEFNMIATNSQTKINRQANEMPLGSGTAMVE